MTGGGRVEGGLRRRPRSSAEVSTVLQSPRKAGDSLGLIASQNVGIWIVKNLMTMGGGGTWAQRVQKENP